MKIKIEHIENNATGESNYPIVRTEKKTTSRFLKLMKKPAIIMILY